MPNPFLLLQLLVAIVVLALAAFLVVALTAVALAALAVGLVLHKLGWDRRLLAYLASRHGVRVVATRTRKGPVDDFDAPIEARWTLIDSGSDEPRRPG